MNHDCIKAAKGFCGRPAQGRRLARRAATLITLGLLVVIGTIFRQNIEEVSSQFGLNDLLSNGVNLLVGIGTSNYVVWSFFFFLGVTVTLWVDAAIKNFQQNQGSLLSDAVEEGVFKRNWTRIYYSFAADRFSHDEFILSAKIKKLDQKDSFEYRFLSSTNGTPSVTYQIELEFSRPFPDAVVIVVGERGQVTWRVTRLATTYVSLEVRGDFDRYELAIEVAEFARDGEKFEVEKWYNPIRPQIVQSAPILSQNIPSKKTDGGETKTSAGAG